MECRWRLTHTYMYTIVVYREQKVIGSLPMYVVDVCIAATLCFHQRAVASRLTQQALHGSTMFAACCFRRCSVCVSDSQLLHFVFGEKGDTKSVYVEGHLLGMLQPVLYVLDCWIRTPDTIYTYVRILWIKPEHLL